jgi:lipopolysaccharide biosynthesis glycosyltransferase
MSGPATASGGEAFSTGPVHLFFAADARAILPAGVAISTTLRQLTPGREAVVHLLAPAVPKAGLRRIERIVSLRPGVTLNRVELDPSLLEGIGRVNHLPPLACGRLFIPRLIDAVPRVLYLDIDLVTKCDVAELWQTDLEGHAAAAVADEGAPTLADADWLAGPVDDLGLAGDVPFFNSGVMVIDTKTWEATGVAEGAIGHLRRYGQTLHALDQDALNLHLAGNWKPVDRRWNLQVRQIVKRRGPQQPMERGSIYHFAGSRKPWTRGKHPYRRAYLSELRRSGWFADTRLSSLPGYTAWRARSLLSAGRSTLHEKLARARGTWDRSKREVYG